MTTRRDQILITGAVLLFVLALAAYVSDFRLAPVVTEGELVVGRVSGKEGNIRRELLAGNSFTSIDMGASLYDGDTVVTDPGSSATLSLEEGTTIRLGPSTMIRLVFERESSLGWVSGVATVEVVSGKVVGEAKSGRLRVLGPGKQARVLERGAVGTEIANVMPYVPPRSEPVPEVVVPEPAEELEPMEETPKPAASTAGSAASSVPAPGTVVAPPVAQASAGPSPAAPPQLTEVAIHWPVNGAHIRATQKRGKPASANATLKWIAKPAGFPLRAFLYQVSRGPTGELSRKELHSESLRSTGKLEAIPYTFEAPGSYEWELQGSQGGSLAGLGDSVRSLTVDKEFQGIEPNNPLVGGAKNITNRLDKSLLRDFDVLFSWRPGSDVEDYEVWIDSSPDASRPAFRESTGRETSLKFRRGKVFSGRVYHQVKARLNNGFVAVSPIKPFIFNFLSPLLTSPPDGATWRRGSGEGPENSLLFTWQKTNFTDEYVFEVATDSQFKHKIHEETLDANFLRYPAPGAGRYYWRVRARSGDLESPPGDPSSIIVQ